MVTKASEFKNIDVIRSFIGSREIDDVKTKTYPTIQKMNKDFKKVKNQISSNSLTSHKQMMVENEIAQKKLKRLYPKGTFKISLKLVKKKSHILSQNAKTWCELFKEHLNQFSI